MTTIDREYSAEAAGGQGDTATPSVEGERSSGTGDAGRNGFLSNLPEEIRGHAALDGIRNHEEMARALIASREGRPDSADAYEVPAPEGVPTDEAMVNWFRETAHEAGLTQSQAKSLAEKWNAFTEGVLAARQGAQADALQELRQAWGERFDGNVAKGVRMVDTLEGSVPGFKEWLDETGLGDNPMFLRVFARLGEIVSEDSLVAGRGAYAPQGPERINGMPMIRFTSMKD